MLRIFLLVMSLVLSGCAAWHDKTAPADTTKPPLSLKTWSMEGRIGVQSKNNAWTASLNWEHDATQDRLRISGPFSQGMVSIIVQDDLIYLNEGHGKTELSRDPDALLRQKLGFSIPLSSLRFWIVGVPDPDKPSSMDAPGFQQAGWRVVPENLARTSDWQLPKKLLVDGAGVRLKILADEWKIRN